MKINEEDGGENGKRARKAGLYSRSGGEGCPCPIGPRLTASCNSQVVRLQLKYNILAVSMNKIRTILLDITKSRSKRF
jgi:hypothetical protein